MIEDRPAAKEGRFQKGGGVCVAPRCGFGCPACSGWDTGIYTIVRCQENMQRVWFAYH